MSLIETAIKKFQEGASRSSAPAQPGAAAAAAVGLGELRSPDPASSSGKRIYMDREALRSAGLLPPDLQRRQLSNQYRRIKRPLLAAATGRGGEKVPQGHLIMVASALPGEGKSFTIVNLALSVSMERDATVLLVDADLAKPHISTAFGVIDEPGLVDALQSPTVDVEGFVVPTDVPGLSILPAGHHVDTATELLSSARMQQVVARLSEADPRRIILFDSPPLLLTNESRVLTDIVGQVLVVVRADVTSRVAVMDALSVIADQKAVSLVLNQSESLSQESYYGYGEYGNVPRETEGQGEGK